MTWVGVANGTSDTASLVGTNELKPEFPQRGSLKNLTVFVYLPSGSTGVENQLVRILFYTDIKKLSIAS